MTETLPVDLAQARRFLESLGSSAASRETWQVIPERPGASALAARVLIGSFDELAPKLVEANQSGAGIFLTINATDGRGRLSSNVVALRALFVDCDGPPRRPWALPPSIVVRTARGLHAYWLLAPGESLERFRGAQEALAAFYGSDPKVKDLPRVMRVPGFLHLKGVPVLVRLEEAAVA